MSGQSLGWYARRLTRMSPTEVGWRARDRVLQAAWRSRQVRSGQVRNGSLSSLPERRFTAALPPNAGDAVPDEAKRALVERADEIMAGRMDVLGVQRTDVGSPDWFLDPVTGRRSPRDRYAFGINHRSEHEVGNVKQVWELSRHHQLTVLAAGWFLTKEEAYAARVAEQLGSWWLHNPFLSGIHWTSGIEVGIRLISWTWIRRLLDAWPPVVDLFEANKTALRQLHWHQRYLATFQSHGSSANNHVIAEAAGRLTAACTFPWFAESRRWRTAAAAVLERELAANTFDDGINRELASDYHRFVAELACLAAVEADAAGVPLGTGTWDGLSRMFDGAAALVDESGRPPRQGDGDEGRALVLDPPDADHWSALLALGGAVIGPRGWWPATAPDVLSTLVGALARPDQAIGRRPDRRPSHFADAGLTVLRTVDDAHPEIWCRCDGGPHGFLAIAAHAHADALSLEVRVGGVDVLADPGTYCYHGEPEWRRYFRSTLAHNTVELADRGQSTPGGPFLWLRHASGRVIRATTDDASETATWCAEHDGYASLTPPARHRRTVCLHRGDRTLQVVDAIDGDGSHQVRMAYHLGPDVHADLAGSVAHLKWRVGVGTAQATVQLPEQLDWTPHSGEADPVLGWYSPRFGQKVPATTLLGTGRTEPGTALHTRLSFS